jgi:hypothetical protein
MMVTYEGDTMRPKDLAAKLSANGRPMCRVCRVDMGPGRDLCVACEPAYEAMRADVVEFLHRSGCPGHMIYAVEVGECDGFAAKKLDGAK